MSTRFVRLEVKDGKLVGLLIDGSNCVPIDVYLPEETKVALPGLLGLVKQEPVKKAPAKKADEPVKKPALVCSSCGAPITAGVVRYSVLHYGVPLCMKCRRVHREGDNGVLSPTTKSNARMALQTRPVCSVCGDLLSVKEADYCKRHGMKPMCYECQHRS